MTEPRQPGISRFEADARNYYPVHLRRAVPEQTEALRKTCARLCQADLLDSTRS